MKKIILIASLMTSFAGLSASGQGYFQFQTAKSQVWDGFSTGVAHVGTTVNVAFLWGPNGAVPTVESILNGVPTNMTIFNGTYNAFAAWSAILYDPNFTLAVDNNSNNVVVTRSTPAGAINYNGGNPFQVVGTSAGSTHSLFMIGWDANYATPARAAEAFASVGWSSVFSYTPSSATGLPTSFAGLTPAFGVCSIIPEPTAPALAGLGGLTILLFRRWQTQRVTKVTPSRFWLP